MIKESYMAPIPESRFGLGKLRPNFVLRLSKSLKHWDLTAERRTRYFLLERNTRRIHHHY